MWTYVMMFFSQTYLFPFLYIITQYANTKLSGHTHFCAIAQKVQRHLVGAWGVGEFLFYFDVLLKHLITMNLSWGTSTASDEERRACMLGDLTRFDTRTWPFLSEQTGCIVRKSNLERQNHIQTFYHWTKSTSILQLSKSFDGELVECLPVHCPGSIPVFKLMKRLLNFFLIRICTTQTRKYSGKSFSFIFCFKKLSFIWVFSEHYRSSILWRLYQSIIWEIWDLNKITI